MRPSPGLCFSRAWKTDWLVRRECPVMDAPLKIEKLLWRGRGLARRDSGKVVMVEPGALPGELVRVRVLKEGKDHDQAEVREIVEAHPARRPHPCHHSPDCGGCRFGVVDSRAALDIKQAILTDALARAGRRVLAETADTSLTVVPSPASWRYRHRVQVHVRSGRPHFLALGSDRAVPLDDCPLMSQALNRDLAELSGRLDDGRVCLASSPADGVTAAETDQTPLRLPYPGFGLELRVPARCFFQANWELNTVLVHKVDEALADCERVADLYAGTGNFALPLATKKREILAVEGSTASAEVGQVNALNLGLDRVRFVQGNLSKAQAWAGVHNFRAEAAVIDPPRAGGRAAASHLAALDGLRRVIWVSCDIVNTCRDLMP
ncbi:MAG: class I SAM-dependent RNA methyltransferase, partial [Deltaproteobacteria bacterium]|nr:class I SAM-dependent RNA methyltransferase [Deltaproteobacteria bacterium]